MKILLVHKYLYRKAGAEAHFFDLAKTLQEHGHEVAIWGTAENIDKTQGIKILEPLVDEYRFNQREGLIKDIKKAGHYIWSLEAKQKFEIVLKNFKPDIIHLHNIYHHLTPSILPITKKMKIPVVMTVHDWNSINPNYALHDHEKICERKGISALSNKCIQDSYSATALSLLKFAIQNRGKFYHRYINTLITPTDFVRNKLINNGFDKKQVKTLAYPIQVNTKTNKQINTKRPYILYAGRLSQEKGIDLLLKVAKQLPNINFKIAGTGPLHDETLNKTKNKTEYNNTELLGFVSQQKLFEIIKQARIIIVPSLWYDPSPFAVLEAQALGKVVLGSKIGGIQNLITNKKDGILLPLLYKEGAGGGINLDKTSKNWSKQINKIFNNNKLIKQLGQSASDTVKIRNNPEKFYKGLMEIYKK
jgi:glycosyltransferase involved in cell wall biosynthesis